MEDLNLHENINMIRSAYSILENSYAFHNSTVHMQMSFFNGISEEDYKRLDYKLKAIRQDFAKILVIMNIIDKTYSAYQKNEYKYSYYSKDNQATSELGCFIEYLFVKYRVILEYIQQILEICLPPKFNETQINQYKQLKKAHKKYSFLLNFVASDIGQKSNLLNMNWFQKLRIERDFIIHDGATCLVFEDKQNLLFKIMTTDALDRDEEYDEEDSFFANKNGLKYYSRYWGLQISKLIIFSELIFEFLLSDAEMSDNAKFILNNAQVQSRNKFVDKDGTEAPDKQDVLVSMLKSILEQYDFDNST